MIKKGKTILGGFTLIELMVAIAIIGIMTIGISNIDWNRLSDKQRATIFKNRIISELETIRNNALFGKSILVSGDQIVPDMWRINLSQSEISTQYSIDDGDTYSNPASQISISAPEEISRIFCGSSSTPIGSSEGINIDIRNQNMIVGGDCNQNTVNIELGYKQDPNFTQTIEINSVSGLIGDKQ